MSEVSIKPAGGSFWFSVCGIVGCFLVFVFILYVAYLPSRDTLATTPFQPTPEEQKELEQLPPADRETRLAELRWSRGLPSGADRKARLVEAQTRDAQAMQGYSWIDREKGVVRLPISRAMELTVAEQRRTRPAN